MKKKTYHIIKEQGGIKEIINSIYNSDSETALKRLEQWTTMLKDDITEVFMMVEFE